MIVCLLPVILLACSNNKRTPQLEETFVTKIEDNGLKLFSYTLSVAGPAPSAGGKRGGVGLSGKGRGSGGSAGGGRGAGGNKSGGRGQGGNMDPKKKGEKFAKKILEQLTLKVEQSGYCREGFIEIDRQITRGYGQVRGECKEGASDADREKFAAEDSV